MTETRPTAVHIIGGGLAGSEAAWQIAQRGVPVVLHEMRPVRTTAAHKTSALAELVCSNSFRSDDREHNAVGLLHAEMRRLGSLVMRAADDNQVPAGGALAVDRDGFAAAVTAALTAHPLIDSPPRGGGRPAADRLGQRQSSRPAPSPRRRWPKLWRPRPARTRSPSSTPSRRSCITTASTCRSPGCSRATTRQGPAAPAPTTSTARSPASSTRPSSMPCSPATRFRFTSSKPRPPISTAACRSR